MTLVNCTTSANGTLPIVPMTVLPNQGGGIGVDLVMPVCTRQG